MLVSILRTNQYQMQHTLLERTQKFHQILHHLKYVTLLFVCLVVNLHVYDIDRYL